MAVVVCDEAVDTEGAELDGVVCVLVAAVELLSLLNSFPNSARTTLAGNAFDDGTGSMTAVLSESGMALSAHTIKPRAIPSTTICDKINGQVRAVGL